MNHAEILRSIGHRPWPLRHRGWVMQMRWLDLAFLHWPLPAEVIRPLIPSGLELDTFEGKAWIGVVPFRMEEVCFRLSPPVPTASAFSELNVRTYVRGGGRSGVWFFSLDATSRLAVWGARQFFNLPYFDAAIRAASWESGGGIHYQSRRVHHDAPPAVLETRYRPTSKVFHAAPGSIEHWLTERYCLFSQSRRGLIAYQDIHHRPWSLQLAEVELETNTMAAAAGITLPPEPPLAHFAASLDVLAWGGARCEHGALGD